MGRQRFHKSLMGCRWQSTSGNHTHCSFDAASHELLVVVVSKRRCQPYAAKLNAKESLAIRVQGLGERAKDLGIRD